MIEAPEITQSLERRLSSSSRSSSSKTLYHIDLRCALLEHLDVKDASIVPQIESDVSNQSLNF